MQPTSRWFPGDYVSVGEHFETREPVPTREPLDDSPTVRVVPEPRYQPVPVTVVPPPLGGNPGTTPEPSAKRRADLRAEERRSEPACARPYTLQPHELRAQVCRERNVGTDPLPAEKRPQTRAECVHGHRPCPWLGCRYHLWLDVHPDAGSIKINRPDALAWIESDDPSVPAPTCESCALDVADRGGHLLEEVGDMVGLCHERVRQIEQRMLRELRAVRWEVTL